ncbi:MAG: sugar-binding transcriptional regulator [Anaerolineae bacterium]
MGRLEELRLMAKVANLYYMENLKQTEIAQRLELSQAGVSRLLKRALDDKIVRITVSTPIGYYPELEEQIRARYHLRDVIVVDNSDENGQLLRNLGAAAAYYLETTVREDEVIGISSWSETLLAMANAMQPLNRMSNTRVIQILGGVGNPNAEAHATQLTRKIAGLVNGRPIMLPAPGIVGSSDSRDILLSDPYIQDTLNQFEDVTLALVGVGGIEPSRFLAQSGNVYSTEELEALREQGAVGDVCLRFFDADGQSVASTLDKRVIGMSLEQLKRVRRTVGVAGGERKTAAIRGALLGGWIHVLVTDHATAEELAMRKPASPEENSWRIHTALREKLLY